MFKILLEDAKRKEAAAAVKQYPLLKNWEDFEHYMAKKKTFLINSKEISFWLPLDANHFLQKAIRKSPLLTTFTIQEDSFNEKDWSIISQGIIERKYSKDSPLKLKITFTKINKNNVPFITDLLHKANISEVFFHDCTFDEGTFRECCLAISKSAPHLLQTVHLTTNNLTEDQIKEVVIKIRKKLVLYKSQIRTIKFTVDVKELKRGCDRYVFEDVEEFSLDNLKVEDPRLCYAVKTSKCLQKITINTAVPRKWSWMKAALLENKSIKSIKVISADTSFANERMFEIMPEIFAQNNITELEILEHFDFAPEELEKFAELIAMNFSLKHLILNGFSRHDRMRSAIKQHKSLTAITMKACGVTKEQLVELLESNPRISKLTFKGVDISSQDNHIKEIFVNSLHEFHLHRAPVNALLFSKAISKSTSLRAFSFTESSNPSDMSFMKNIITRNNIIQELNFLSSKITSADLAVLLEGLKNNTTLTKFSCELHALHCETFTEILRNNTTLTHLGISFDPFDFNAGQLEDLAGVIEGSKKLKSFSAATERKHAVVMQLIENSTSITSFEYRTVEWIGSFSCITELLEINKSLNQIALYEKEVKAVLNPAIRDLLKRNKDQQVHDTNNLLLFIGTIAARPQLYLSILPLEVWSNIFKRILVSGVAIDFDQTLLKRL
jgi:hypothetical protein